MKNISELAYELYKIDWKKSHMVTPEVEKDSLKDYYEGLVDFDDSYSYEEYIEEFGYLGGQIYACFDEFMDNEYLDEEYIKELLNNDSLFNEYELDLQEHLNLEKELSEPFFQLDILDVLSDSKYDSIPSDVKIYYAEKIDASNIKSVPGHYPVLKTKEEVDNWAAFTQKKEELYKLYSSDEYTDNDDFEDENLSDLYKRLDEIDIQLEEEYIDGESDWAAQLEASRERTEEKIFYLEEKQRKESESSMDIKNVLNDEPKIRYQLLSRMKMDCDYYLGNEGKSRHPKHLWAGDEKEQIEDMKALWNSFPEGEKPEWLSYDDILDYENKMLNLSTEEKFIVYKKSPGGIKEAINEFETEQEAIEFAEMLGWNFKDENDFVWDLEIAEVQTKSHSEKTSLEDKIKNAEARSSSSSNGKENKEVQIEL